LSKFALNKSLSLDKTILIISRDIWVFEVIHI
jgi:hypothetical protein